MDVIASCCPPKVSYGRLHSHAATKPEILSNICELLCFCVLHHPYRIKSSFLSNNAIEKVLSLTHRREKSLVIAAVRFMRAIISRNDEHLHCHIVKNNLLKPIMDVFFENGNRYNMLHSVVLELFEYICKENYKTLIVYIFDSFWERLMKFQHLGSIRAFRTKYEQSLENFGIKNTANAAGTKRRIDEQALEKEEAYFKENRLLSGGLVDYEDDDEEEDNLKPPRMSEASTGDNENRKPAKSKRKSVSKIEIKDELELSKKQRLDQWSGDDGQANVTTASSPSSCPDNTSNTVQSPDITPQIPSDKGNSDKHSNENENENPAASSQHNCLPETADIKQPNIEDCPLTQVSSSSPEMVVNSANSEPYSFRYHLRYFSSEATTLVSKYIGLKPTLLDLCTVYGSMIQGTIYKVMLVDQEVILFLILMGWFPNSVKVVNQQTFDASAYHLCVQYSSDLTLIYLLACLSSFTPVC